MGGVSCVAQDAVYINTLIDYITHQIFIMVRFNYIKKYKHVSYYLTLEIVYINTITNY